MDQGLLYWHWLLVGTCLALSEIFYNRFLLLWPGLGATAVGLVLIWLPNLGLSGQGALFLLVMAGSFACWHWLHRPGDSQSREDPAAQTVVGEAGTVVRVPRRGRRGRVRFSGAILGREEWLFRCEQPVAEGDRVYIRAVRSRELDVVKL